MSVIGRTAGIGATLEEIQWDLDYLTQLYDAIAGAADANLPHSLFIKRVI